MTENAPEAPQGEPEVDQQPSEDKTDWKAEARKWEARAKQNSDAAKRLGDIEEASKSELQKAIDRAAAAEAALASAQAESLRLTVAARHGISGDNLDLLVGSTEDELEVKAKKIASLITDSGKTDPFPKADPSQGGHGTGAPSTADLFARFAEKKL